MMFSMWRRGKDKKPSLQDVLGDTPLPTFSSLVLEVLGLLRDPDVPVRTIAKRVMTDPSLSIRVLRMANSAAFGAQRTIDDVAHAVVFLGRRPVESLVLSVAVRDTLPQAPAPGFEANRFWRTSARRERWSIRVVLPWATSARSVAPSSWPRNRVLGQMPSCSPAMITTSHSLPAAEAGVTTDTDPSWAAVEARESRTYGFEIFWV